MADQVPPKKGMLIDAGVPEMEGRDGYYATYLSMKLHLATWLSSPDGGSITDQRVFLFTELLISHITDGEERERLRKLLKEKEIEFLEGQKDPSNEDRSLAKREACFFVQGQVTSWFDKFVGVTSKNVIELV